MKVLFLPSHVGLGHVTRDRAIAKILSKAMPKVKIMWCSAEPAYGFLKSWNLNIINSCKRLKTFSTVIEKIFNRSVNLKWLASRLNILRQNYTLLQEIIDLEAYDLIIADEFWELMLSGNEEVRERTIFMTDFVGLSYTANLKMLPISLILNTYFSKAFLKFKRKIFLGNLGDAPEIRLPPIRGKKSRDWIWKNMYIAGPATSFTLDEVVNKREARKDLCLNDKLLIVVSVGGTSTRSALFLDTIWKRLVELRKIIPLNAIFIKGPRTRWKPKKYLEGFREVQAEKSLLKYYIASDIFISRAGRTTVADLECLGKRSILIPIKGHAEQLSIAKNAKKRSPIWVFREKDISNIKFSNKLPSILGKRELPIRINMCSGNYNAAKIILRFIKS